MRFKFVDIDYSPILESELPVPESVTSLSHLLGRRKFSKLILLKEITNRRCKVYVKMEMSPYDLNKARITYRLG